MKNEIILNGPNEAPIFPLLARYKSESEKSEFYEQVGTCFAISATALMLTATHVIARAPKTLPIGSVPGVDMAFRLSGFHVATGSGPSLAVPVARYEDQGNDICVLHIDIPNVRIEQPFSISQTRDTYLGRPILCYGYRKLLSTELTPDSNRLEIEQYHVRVGISVRMGCISGIYEAAPPYMQGTELPLPCYELDRPIAPGMSGGPLIDIQNANSWKVIGILSKNFSYQIAAHRSDTSGSDGFRETVALAVCVCGFVYG